MRIFKLDTLRKDIHFPINRAIYKKPPKRSWWKKIWKFATYKRHYELMHDYVLYIPILDKYLFVPSGFLYDNASVPKVLSSFFNADGMLLLGALPHDFGYRYECLVFVDMVDGHLYIDPYTKKELDALFKYLCGYESGFKKASGMASFGLRLFGGFGWRSNRKRFNSLPKDFPSIYAEAEDESFKE